MKILFACSECSPFAASGGLADVAGSLPAALQKEGAECRVIMPLYSSIGLQWRSNMTFLTSFGVPLSWRVAHCGVFTLQHGGVQSIASSKLPAYRACAEAVAGRLAARAWKSGRTSVEIWTRNG